MSGSHWGTFIARVQDGRIVRIVPVPEDPAPTPMIRNFPELVHGHTRIRQPMVRQSWLDGGPGTATERRGAEPFVPVDWDTALELVRGELDRATRRSSAAPTAGARPGGCTSPAR
jgi:trimethylamine-N-oxide reductase (cytochrome c)